MITNREKTFVSVVLYVHNNAEQVRKFLPFLHVVLAENFEKFEIICVNDASIDGSREEIKRFSKTGSRAMISVVNMSSFHGRELAMEAGVDLAIGDFVYEFDYLDGDYDLSLILDVYRKALEGYDIVSAVPRTQTGKVSRLFYGVFNRYSHSKNRIRQESFRILSRRAINRVKSINSTLVYRKAVYASCGLSMETIPYQNKKRTRKNTREETANQSETAIETLILFTNVIQRLALYVSLAFLFMTIVIGLYTWVIYFGVKKPVEGWTPLMLFLSMGFFGVFFILTIILQYLSVILKMIFKKKQYLIESIEKMGNN